MVQNAKQRAKRGGLEFSIVVSDISIPDICPLLGIPLVYGQGGHRANSPSLDRINNSLGYIPGNVWVISNRANAIKRDASLEEIELIGRSLRQKLHS